MFDSFFNSIFGSLIEKSPTFALLFICFFLTLVTTIAYKYLTDQKMLKRHKEEMKEMQKEINSLKDNPKKMMEKQKEMMEKNMKIILHSMKPTLFTLIPLIIIFGWLSVTFTYEPLAQNIEFPVKATFDKSLNGEIIKLTSSTLDIKDTEKIIEKNEAIWNVKGPKGEHEIIFTYNDQNYSKNILITNEWKPLKTEFLKNSYIKKIEVGNRFKSLLGLPWIWVYIISSVIFSIILRKLLKIY